MTNHALPPPFLRRLGLAGAFAAVATLLGCSPDETSGPALLKEKRGPYTIVWLEGTPYEMGYQHGQALREELALGVETVQHDALIRLMFDLALEEGIVQIALDNSYPEIIEECQGMVDGAQLEGWTMTECILLSSGDVTGEFATEGVPDVEDITPGCLNVMASGSATGDGGLYHARMLDWAKVDFVVEHPTIFVRRPATGIPHVTISFPGNIGPYQGMNAAGLVVASNETPVRDNTVHDRTGESHVQMVARLLATAESLDDARALITAANHMTVDQLAVSDAAAGQGEVYEMAPAAVGVRTMTDDVVFHTNHFVAPETAELDAEPPGESSLLRWQRLEQLVLPDGADSLHGSLSPDVLVTVLRDRIHPVTKEESGIQWFDNNESIATNGALYSLVFDGAGQRFWLAAGAIPVPAQPFTGFSLTELLGEADPSAIPPTIP